MPKGMQELRLIPKAVLRKVLLSIVIIPFAAENLPRMQRFYKAVSIYPLTSIEAHLGYGSGEFGEIAPCSILGVIDRGITKRCAFESWGQQCQESIVFPERRHIENL